ncbi:hypothetical protein BDA99DRAFT_543460 [Phascolomyces articulosus]|uniref:Chitin-binding type-2 domain-containing protein n=1 Tax=Phascolomyces articulosus TaxID=60185 RepID=A0AAD5JY32_9FUNG|nr:hypothetical protein BDA99DRAFT_543460 [Phascolomyces articulosus]
MYPTKHLLIVLIFATITITTKVFSQSIDTTSKSPQRDHQNANDPTDDVLERFLQLIEDENDYHRLKSQEAAKNPCDKLRIEDRSFVNIHQISCTTFYRCVQDISSIEKYSSLWYECDSGLQINKNAQKCEPAEKIKCKEEQSKSCIGE